MSEFDYLPDLRTSNSSSTNWAVPRNKWKDISPPYVTNRTSIGNTPPQTGCG